MQPTQHSLQQLNNSMFNGFVGTSVFFALSELGFFDLVENREAVTALEAAEVLSAKPHLLEALCDTMYVVGVLAKRNDHYALTPNGRELCKLLGYFAWAVGGYGNLLLNLSGLTLGTIEFGRDIGRNDSYVAQGAGAVGRQFVWPLVSDVLDQVAFRRVADLGCGNADLLIAICQRYPHVTGVGVDISADACQLARDRIIQAKLDERITILQADVIELVDNPASLETTLLQQVDIVSSFFMLHDLIRDSTQSLEMLNELKCTFPQVTRFVFGDTMKTDSLADLRQLPVFSLAFELVHAFMGHRIWKKETYDDLFAACDLIIESCIPMPIPFSWLYILKPLQLGES